MIDLIADYPNDPLAACRKVVAESYQAWLQYEVRADDITIIIIKIHAGLASSEALKEVVSPLAGMELKPVRRGMTRDKKLQLVGDDEDAEDEDGLPLEEPHDTKSAPEREAIITALKHSFLFQGLAKAQLEYVARSAKTESAPAGKAIIKQGDEGNNLYIVKEGKFEVRVREEGSPPGSPGRVVHHYEGSQAAAQHPVFGELALQYKGTVRQATVTATTDASVWAITRKVYKSVCLRMSTRKELLRTLRRVEVLHSLSLAQLQRLADVVSDARFNKGDNVMSEGEPGDAMYVVFEGTAVATKQMNGKLTNLVTYEVGDYFGERALLTNEPRAANVTATSNVLKCYRIERDVFELELGPLHHLIESEKRRSSQDALADANDVASQQPPENAVM